MKNKIIGKIKKYGLFIIITSVLSLPFYYIIRFCLLIGFNLIKIKKKQILFYSIPDYSDNAKYYYNYLRKNRKGYKFIWLTKEPTKYNTNSDTRFVLAFSKVFSKPTIKSLYYILSSEELYYTHVSPFQTIPNKMRKRQIVINLWHGCGYKKNEIKSKSKPLFDYALVPGDAFVETKSEFWNCDKNQILTIGYPRYDLFFQENDRIDAFFNKYQLNDKKIIIWMPTFRKTGDNHFAENNIKMAFDLPILNNEEELNKINDICKEKNLFLIIKRHPVQVQYSCEKNNYSNILFIDNKTLEKNNIELYSLLKYTLGLITDYSSIAIDYLLLDKQIAFTLDDFEQYAKIRGFVFDNPLEYMPGKLIYNYDDMISFLSSIENGEDIYKVKRKEIIPKVHNKCNNYCDRLFYKINEIKGGISNEKK